MHNLKWVLKETFFCHLSPLSQTFGSGLGFGLQARYRTQANWAFGAGYHYNVLFPKGGGIAGLQFNLNRLSGILEYYFLKSSGSPFIGVEPSLYFLSYSYSVHSQGSGSISQSNFGSAFSIGYELGFAERLVTVFSLKYHYILPVNSNNLSGINLFPVNIANTLVEFCVGIKYRFGELKD